MEVRASLFVTDDLPCHSLCWWQILAHIAEQENFKSKGGSPNVEAAAGHLVQRFRDGKLGRMCLDPLEEYLGAE